MLELWVSGFGCLGCRFRFALYPRDLQFQGCSIVSGLQEIQAPKLKILWDKMFRGWGVYVQVVGLSFDFEHTGFHKDSTGFFVWVVGKRGSGSSVFRS